MDNPSKNKQVYIVTTFFIPYSSAIKLEDNIEGFFFNNLAKEIFLLNKKESRIHKIHFTNLTI